MNLYIDDNVAICEVDSNGLNKKAVVAVVAFLVMRSEILNDLKFVITTNRQGKKKVTTLDLSVGFSELKDMSSEDLTMLIEEFAMSIYENIKLKLKTGK